MRIEQKIQQLDQDRLVLLKQRNKAIPRMLLTGLAASITGASTFGLIGFLAGLILSVVVGGVFYWTKIGLPFSKLKFEARQALLKEFMDRYHPNISYKYDPDKKDVRSIVKSSKLISANKFLEEDVLEGNYKGSSFYLSEIHLKVQSDKSSRTVFKGILFRFTLPGKVLPRTRIQSKLNLLKRIFSGFYENKEYGFWIESDDIDMANSQLKSLYPFIRHLASKDGDLRIRIDGNEVVMMLGSDMKFLDDPKPRIDATFDNPLYFQNMGKQLNSLLYIMQAFTDNLDTSEIEERLELLNLPEYELLGRNLTEQSNATTN